MDLRDRLPPGPRLPRALQTYFWLAHPTRFLDWCARRYGTPFTLRVLLGGDMVFLADPESVRTVFTGDPDCVRAGEAYTVMEPTGGPSSIFLLDGPRHLRMRRLLSAPLHGDRLSRWRPVIAELAEREVASWPVGRPFALRPFTEAVTLEVIMRIVFGIREPERADELRDLLPRLFEVKLSQAPAFVSPRLRKDLGRWSPWGRYVRLRARVDELLYDEIARRREDVERELAAGADERDDMLSLLLAARDDEGRGLTDAELRDELVTMLLAGHETTASSLAWAFERLVRHPAALERLSQEIARGEREYLDAVIKETLRSRPVGPYVARHLKQPLEVAGRRLPAGTVVAAAIYLLHNDPEIYPDPRAFRPERFLEGAPAAYTWIPFGGGVRRCLGAGLATMEMQEVISVVVRSVELRPVRERDERFDVLGVTLVPARGAEVVVARRERLPSGVRA